MLHRMAGLLTLLALVLAAPSCARIPEAGSGGRGLESQVLSAPGAIPADWGNLIGVSSVAQYPDLVQLWLQDREGNIRLVVYNVTTTEILHAKLIRRN